MRADGDGDGSEGFQSGIPALSHSILRESTRVGRGHGQPHLRWNEVVLLGKMP